jgi:hypothetical protein
VCDTGPRLLFSLPISVIQAEGAENSSKLWADVPHYLPNIILTHSKKKWFWSIMRDQKDSILSIYGSPEGHKSRSEKSFTQRSAGFFNAISSLI